MVESTSSIQLYGRVLIRGEILAQTGLHIGGSGGDFTIGGNDNPVLVNPLSGEPYIPGSSLKGKMRSLSEKYLGLPMKSHANVTMHTAENAQEYRDSAVAQIYGVPAADFNLPTRLVVRDVGLTEESRAAMNAARVDQYTEIKTEVSIDRITSAANPRSMERVPAGAVFGPMEMVYSIYHANDVELLATLITGMTLLEDDYLGGSGTRGSGHIEFGNLRVQVKWRGENDQLVSSDVVSYGSLDALFNGLPELQAYISQQVGG
jgi:CRISPR-associated protein Csm3